MRGNAPAHNPATVNPVLTQSRYGPSSGRGHKQGRASPAAPKAGHTSLAAEYRHKQGGRSVPMAQISGLAANPSAPEPDKISISFT